MKNLKELIKKVEEEIKKNKRLKGIYLGATILACVGFVLNIITSGLIVNTFGGIGLLANIGIFCASKVITSSCKKCNLEKLKTHLNKSLSNGVKATPELNERRKKSKSTHNKVLEKVRKKLNMCESINNWSLIASVVLALLSRNSILCAIAPLVSAVSSFSSAKIADEEAKEDCVIRCIQSDIDLATEQMKTASTQTTRANAPVLNNGGNTHTHTNANTHTNPRPVASTAPIQVLPPVQSPQSGGRKVYQKTPRP